MRISIRLKWTLALLFTGALPLSLFAYRSTAIQKNGLLGVELQLEAAVLGQASGVLEQLLSQSEEATHRVGRMLTEPSIADPDARLQLAEEAMARAEALDQVAIYDGKGQLLDAINRKGRRPAAPPKQLPAPAASGPSWLPPVYGDGSVALRYVEPILKDGQRRAIVLGALAPEVLKRRLADISRDRFDGRPDGVLLLDEGLRVLAAEGFAVGAPLAGRDLLSSVRVPTDWFAHPMDLVSEFRTGSGEAMLGALHPLASYHFALGVRRPQAAVYSSLRSARQALLVSGAGFAVLAILLGAFLATRTTRPIRALVALTAAYGRRDFGQRSEVRTGDELEDLGQALGQMADELVRSEEEIKRREKIESNLSRFLPQGVAREIASGKQELKLGGERRPLTVLFADVVSFTTFAEQAPPEQVVAFLNELFTVLTEVVFRHGGTVDKFIGDCVMVLFGAPEAQPDQVARALSTAEDFQRFVEASAPAWKARYGIQAQIGIGVHTGEALVGNLGSELRMEYTAIGDVVNTAARLQGLARPGQSLVSGAIASAAGEGFGLVPMGEHPIRGRKQALLIYALP